MNTQTIEQRIFLFFFFFSSSSFFFLFCKCRSLPRLPKTTASPKIKLNPIEPNRNTAEAPAPAKTANQTTCTVCNKQFSRPQELKRHSLIHGGDARRFLCSSCGQTFRSHDGLLYHVSVHHPSELASKGKDVVEPISCKDCGKICTSEYHLKVHLKNSHQRAKSVHTCPVCSKKFERKDVLQGHVESQHSAIKAFRCDTCGKTFGSKSNLQSHRRTHDPQLKLQCSLCGKRLTSGVKLSQHLTLCQTKKTCRSCKFCCQSVEELLEHTRKTHPADFAVQTVFGNSLADEFWIWRQVAIKLNTCRNEHFYFKKNAQSL